MAQVSHLLPMRSSIRLALTTGVAILGMVVVGCSSAADTASTSYEKQLAEHLTAQNATMYGAFWCPHCADQKELFGKAVKYLPYVECDPDGEDPQPQLCRDKNIAGYPTWEIDGEFYPGTRSLQELARLSGFEEE